LQSQVKLAYGPDLAGPDIGRFGRGPGLAWTSGRPRTRRTWPDLDARSAQKRPGLASWLDLRSGAKTIWPELRRPGLVASMGSDLRHANPRCIECKFGSSVVGADRSV